MVSSYIAHIQCSVRFTNITPGHWTCSFMYHFNFLFLKHTALAAIKALGTSRTHCHLCPTRYSFTPESSEACEGKVSCPRRQHQNNVPILRGEKHDISLKILHQAGVETARQAVTLAKLRALAIALRPSLCQEVMFNYQISNHFSMNPLLDKCNPHEAGHFMTRRADPDLGAPGYIFFNSRDNNQLGLPNKL